jgi:hypothetical protein
MRASEFIIEHALVYRKKPKTKNITMKWKCSSGPRKGRVVSNISQCAASPDIAQSARMKVTRKRTKAAQARKAKKTKRVDPIVKAAALLNKIKRNAKKRR